MLSEALSIQEKNEHLPGQKEENAITDITLYTKSQIMNVYIALVNYIKLSVSQEYSVRFTAERDEVGNQMGNEHVHGIRKTSSNSVILYVHNTSRLQFSLE